MSEDTTRPTYTPEAEPELQVPGRVIEVIDPHFTKRDEHGKWLPGQRVSTGIMPGDSNRARELARRRWDKAEQLSRQRIKEKAEELNLDARGPADAFAAGVAEVYGGAVMQASERPHDASKALAFVGKAAGFLRPQEHAQAVAAVQFVVNLSPAVAASWRAAGIVEGEGVEDT